MKIVLFEDDAKIASKIVKAIKKHLPAGGTVVLFSPSAAETTALYEARLAKDVSTSKLAKASLWVTDRDLSQTNTYQGLSEAAVSKVASNMGIPICKYAQGTTNAEFERQRDWGDAQIILDIGDIDCTAKRIVILAKGFEEITASLAKIVGRKTKKVSTPAGVMASLLGRPDAVDKIALYASGDQKMVAEILPFTTSASARNDLMQRLPSLLGYWLYDSILRFPGLFVNEVAAASYLNISLTEFAKKPVRALFKAALYTGPFSDATEPHWWRSDLDRMVSASGSKDGNELAQKKLKRKVAFCLDNRKSAGWYCMVTKRPVSEENSVGSISWFPPGADLARVEKSIYDKSGPWLGLY